MSKLYFKIGADYDKVIRLRDEIAKLKKELLSMNQAANPREFARLERQLRQTSQEFENLVRQAALAATQMQNTTVNINHTTSSLGGMNSMLAKIGGTVALSKLASDIIYVRGAFQQLEMAFETMLKSKEKASALMAQIIETAAKTPFDLQGVTNGAKQLLAYGTEAKDVNDTLIRLGNIASGLSIPLGDMIYLYGTTQTQGRLFTQDVRQFMGRGIPLVKELSNELGKTEQQINEMVTAGKIGFPEVERVIHNMTNEGGQFYNLMERQSASLSGQISNLGDAWNSMLNEIGTQTQETASAGISVLSTLIENYEEVGVVLASLILGYGSYRTAIVIVNMLEKVNITLLRQAIIEKRLAAAANITLSNSMAIAAARGKMFASIQRNIISSFKGIGRTLTNPYVLFGAAVGAATYGLYKFYTRETEVERMQRQYNETKEAAIKHEEEHKTKVDELINSLENEVTAQMEQVGAIETLKQLYPGIIEKYIDEEGHLKNIIVLKKELAELNANKKVEQNKTELQSYDERIKNQEEYINRMHTNDQSAFDDEVAKLEELKRQRELSRANVAADYINKAISESKTMSDTDIANTIDTYQKALSSNKDGEWFDSDKEFKIDDIKRYISALKNLQTARANVVHNKEYWSTQKKEAEKVIESIASSQKKLMDAGKFDGIDSAIVESYKKNTKLLKEAEKELKVYDTSSKQESEAEKQKNAQEKYKLLLDKQGREQARMKIDSLHELEQIEINGLEEGSEKVLRQRKLNHEKELEQIKREAEDNKLKEIEKARTVFEANPENKGKSFDVDKFVKSEPAKKQFAVFDKVAETKTKNADTKYNRGDDLKGLLNEYQDYTDKRLAIERKFNEDIAVLQEQRKQAVKSGDTPQVEQIDRSIAQATRDKGMGLMSLDYDKLKESPEYVRAFENLKETSSETLNALLSQLENAKQTAAKVLSPDQLREYTTTIQEIMDELDSRNPFQALSDKKQELAEAEEELANAQIELENARTQAEAVKGGAKIENGVKSSKFNEKTGKIDSTKAYLTEAQALDKVKDKTAAYNSAKDKVVKKSAKVKKAEKDVTKQIDELSKAVSDVGAAIGGPAGEIISLIGDIGSFTMMAMDGVKAAADTSANAISTVEKASVILAIISAAVQIATKIFDMFGKDTTTENYEKAKEAYESYINILDRVIEKQLELAESLSGENANAAYQKALDTIKEQSSNARVLGKQYLDSGASRKSHSKGYDEVRDMSWEGWNQAANALGMSVDNFKNKMGGRMTGLFDLTDEQLVKLQEDAGIFWSQLDSDTQNYADQIVNGVAKITEVIEQSMTDTTLIDVVTLRSDFLDLLTDMDADSASFAGNFEEYMRNAILNSMLKQDYMERLKKWREKFYAAMDNGVTEEEYNALKDEGQQIADEMKNRRDEMADMFGWTGENSSQSSTQKGFQAMSQETGEELNGRFTALQIAGEEIKNQSIIQTGLLSSINEKMTLLDLSNEDIPQLAASSPNIAGQTREIITNSYQPQVNVVFPDAKLDVLTGEVSTMKNIVNEMRTLQVEGNLDTQEIREGIQIISKNSPRVLANMDEMKRDIKNVL